MTRLDGFRDRSEAGAKLATRLMPLRESQPVVVALPRGGVPVAHEIATALGAPLDVLAVRKLGAPGNPELGMGAIAEDGTGVIDQGTVKALGVSEGNLRSVIDREAAELRRRVALYRGERPALDLTGRIVIVVDDGVATGVTDTAALRAIRSRGPEKVVLAVPVCAPEAARMLAKEADEVVCLSTPPSLDGVGRWYRDFSQVSDDEVLRLLHSSNGNGGPDTREVTVEAGEVRLPGELFVPPKPIGLVLFAHGSGSSRLSPRNVAVARGLHRAGLATLLFDLLTAEESEGPCKRLRRRSARGAPGRRHSLGARAGRPGFTPARLFRREHRGSCRPNRSGAASSRARLGRLPRGSARPRWLRPKGGSSADAADRGQPRLGCARPEPPRAGVDPGSL